MKRKLLALLFITIVAMTTGVHGFNNVRDFVKAMDTETKGRNLKHYDDENPEREAGSRCSNRCYKNSEVSFVYFEKDEKCILSYEDKSGEKTWIIADEAEVSLGDAQVTCREKIVPESWPCEDFGGQGVGDCEWGSLCTWYNKDGDAEHVVYSTITFDEKDDGSKFNLTLNCERESCKGDPGMSIEYHGADNTFTLIYTAEDSTENEIMLGEAEIVEFSLGSGEVCVEYKEKFDLPMNWPCTRKYYENDPSLCTWYDEGDDTGEVTSAMIIWEYEDDMFLYCCKKECTWDPEVSIAYHEAENKCTMSYLDEGGNEQMITVDESVEMMHDDDVVVCTENVDPPTNWPCDFSFFPYEDIDPSLCTWYNKDGDTEDLTYARVKWDEENDNELKLICEKAINEEATGCATTPDVSSSSTSTQDVTSSMTTQDVGSSTTTPEVSTASMAPGESTSLTTPEVTSDRHFTLTNPLGGGCIGLGDGGTKPGSTLMLLDCVSDNNAIQWTLDEHGRFHSMADPGLCMQAGHGQSVHDGSMIRMYPCSDSEFQKFDDSFGNSLSGPIMLQSKPNLCVVSRGVHRDIGVDPIILTACGWEGNE